MMIITTSVARATPMRRVCATGRVPFGFKPVMAATATMTVTRAITATSMSQAIEGTGLDFQDASHRPMPLRGVGEAASGGLKASGYVRARAIREAGPLRGTRPTYSTRQVAEPGGAVPRNRHARGVTYERCVCCGFVSGHPRELEQTSGSVFPYRLRPRTRFPACRLRSRSGRSSGRPSGRCHRSCRGSCRFAGRQSR